MLPSNFLDETENNMEVLQKAGEITWATNMMISGADSASIQPSSIMSTHTTKIEPP